MVADLATLGGLDCRNNRLAAPRGTFVSSKWIEMSIMLFWTRLEGLLEGARPSDSAVRDTIGRSLAL